MEASENECKSRENSYNASLPRGVRHPAAGNQSALRKMLQLAEHYGPPPIRSDSSVEQRLWRTVWNFVPWLMIARLIEDGPSTTESIYRKTSYSLDVKAAFVTVPWIPKSLIIYLSIQLFVYLLTYLLTYLFVLYALEGALKITSYTCIESKNIKVVA